MSNGVKSYNPQLRIGNNSSRATCVASGAAGRLVLAQTSARGAVSYEMGSSPCPFPRVCI